MADRAAVLCNVNSPPTKDGIHRSINILTEFDGILIPSLGIGAYLAEENAENAIFRDRVLQIGSKKIPINKSGNTVLNYRGTATTYKNYSAAAVIQSEIRLKNGDSPTIKDPEAFRDKYVFFGFSAPGLMDLRATPMDSMNPGVGIHATVLDNFLSQGYQKPLPFYLSLLLSLVFSVSAGFFVSAINKPLPAGLVIVCFLIAPFGFGFAAYQKGFWLPVTWIETSVLLSIILVLINTYITQGRQKRFIKNAFSQYLSPQVIEQIIRHPEKLSLGGERRDMTVFFSDIRDVTSISERLEPEAVARFLNRYLSAMTDIILDEGGTIDKYEGDAIMAFWNAPLKIGDHAERGVRAAVRCQQKIKEQADLFKQLTGVPVSIGIGINTGPAVVGNMGSKKRFDYTAIGDAVNLASRLESANKQFGTGILISEATWQQLPATFRATKLGKIQVKGREEPVTVFEPEIDTEPKSGD